jgi:replicative DNA helicase
LAEITLFNQNAELAVLSILLRYPNTIFNINDLKSFMFSSQVNNILFETISTIAINKNVPEINLVINTLKARGLLDECGGISYLEYLYNSEYDPSNIKEFELLIINSYKIKEILSISSGIHGMLKDETNADSVISFMKTSLDNLITTGSGDTVVSINTATKSMWDDLVKRMGSADKIESSTGIKSLDLATGGLWKGDCWIIAGRPSMGKTAMICNMILSGAKAGNGQLFFSLEMPKQVLAQRLVSLETGIPISDIRLGLINKKQLEIISEAIQRIKDLPIYIDTNYLATDTYIISTTKKYQKIFGIKTMYLDYIQLLVERGIYATQELGKVSRAIKLYSNDMGITSIIASQLNRDVERRPDRRPVLSDLRQSGNLEEDADIVICLYRDEVYDTNTKHKGTLEMLIRKQRNGPTGSFITKFDKTTNLITDN